MDATIERKRYYRKVIKITAEDSPNVRYGLAQLRAGMTPTGEQLVPGVLSWHLYVRRRKIWDKQRQCVGLDAMFYEGAEVLLFPPDWLTLAKRRAQELKGVKRQAIAIGIDPAEGGDKTTMCAVDHLGVIELVGRKTPDTNVIVGEAIAFMKKHNVPPEQVCFDRGGGGKQHADRMRAQGYKVRTVAFGEPVTLPPKRGLNTIEVRVELTEERYTYLNRRAEMYGESSILIDPTSPPFAIPDDSDACVELHRQLSLIPKIYDGEGRLKLPPKRKKTENSEEISLEEIMGCSPDEGDAFVLAVFGMQNRKKRQFAGAVG